MKLKVTSLLKIACLFAALGLGLASTAHAQWGWTDKDGRRIFSDQGPGSEVPDKSIFKRPGGAKAQAAAVAKAGEPEAAASAPAGAASAAKASASAPKPTGKDSELEKKKKEAETAEAAKKKAEADKFASQQAENCERAKKAKTTYGSGIRIATTNAKGEREIMSDTDRAAESKRIDAVIAADCK
jgi:Domain of unknown function (DUF4124)